MDTINPDGSPVLIEAVYWCYHVVHADECDTIEDAVAQLRWGDENGTLSSIGVFVDGEPRLYDVWIDPHPPSEREAATMLKAYAKIPSKSARAATAPPLPPPSESI